MDEVAQYRLKQNLDKYLNNKADIKVVKSRRDKLAALPEVQEYLKIQSDLEKMSEAQAFCFQDLTGEVNSTILVRDKFGKLFVISKYDVKEVDEAYL